MWEKNARPAGKAVSRGFAAWPLFGSNKMADSGISISSFLSITYVGPGSETVQLL
jgi:hypothetical protein